MEQIKIIKVSENNKDFQKLCSDLEKFQYQLISVLSETDYSLTNDLKDVKAFVMYYGKIAIGSIGLRHINNESCEIVRVYVADKYRGKGYAMLLFSKIEEYACEIGYKRAEMVTWSVSTSALTLYKKLGYKRSEEKISDWFKGLKYVELHKNLIIK